MRWLIEIIKRIIIVSVVVLNVNAIENKYTIKGEETYEAVLEILAEKSNRSVIGATEELQKRRMFFINDKKFSIAIDNIRKCVLQDGYSITTDSNAIYVYKTGIDTTENRVYQVYQPYTKRWIVTKDKQQYLNAKSDDNEIFKKDSIALQKRKRYKLELNIVGFQNDDNIGWGINLDANIRSTLNVVPLIRPVISTGIYGHCDENHGKMDFERNIILYVNDSNQVFHFGSETRRANSTITASQVVTQNYESVYDGLTLIYLSKDYYKLSYRVGDVDIELGGVYDSLIIGSATIKQKQLERQWLFFPSKGDQFSKFTIRAKCLISETD